MSIKFNLSLLFSGFLAVLGLLWALNKNIAPLPVAEYQIRESQIREESSLTPELKRSLLQATIEFNSEEFMLQPKCQGEVAGDTPTLGGYKKSLKSAIFNQHMPEVWLVFHRDSSNCDWPRNTSIGESSTVDVKLSRTAKHLLRNLWAKACIYYYYEIFEKQDPSTQKSRFLAMNLARGNTANELSYLFINAPDKRREIGMDERFALTWHIMNAAQTLVKQAYEAKKRNAPIA